MNHEGDSQNLSKLDNASIMGTGALRNTLFTASDVSAITASTQAHGASSILHQQQSAGAAPVANTVDLIKDMNNHLNISNRTQAIANSNNAAAALNQQSSASSSNSTMQTTAMRSDLGSTNNNPNNNIITANNSTIKHVRENSSNAMDINSPPSSLAGHQQNKMSNGHHLHHQHNTNTNNNNNLAGLYLNKNQKSIDSNLNKLNSGAAVGGMQLGAGVGFNFANNNVKKSLVGGATTSKSNLNTNNNEGIV
jgi:hypothetical protein